MSITIVLIIITVAFSIMGFQKQEFFDKFKFNAYMVYHKKEYFRLITNAFLHGDIMHLIVNMFVLYMFGDNIEKTFQELKYMGYLEHPTLMFIILYFSAVLASNTISLFKHKNNPSYNAIGASGAVSALVFAFVFFYPMEIIRFIIIPLPAILFGVLYLGYSLYMSKRNMDNIGHDAHFMGAVFGFVFPLFIDPGLFFIFIGKFF